MLNTQTSPPKQVLLRLPDDLACRLAKAVPPRQRNRYIVDLLAKDMADKDKATQQLLADAATRLNEIEAQYPELAQESDEWVNAVLTDEEDDGFDPVAFEKELAIAQAKLPPRAKP
ncbi:MAG: hypothetical protein H7172_14400 [Ferruginibacter sp.]|nr:hypothetical protein [Rhodoferax sp.]